MLMLRDISSVYTDAHTLFAPCSNPDLNPPSALIPKARVDHSQQTTCPTSGNLLPTPTTNSCYLCPCKQDSYEYPHSDQQQYYYCFRVVPGTWYFETQATYPVRWNLMCPRTLINSRFFFLVFSVSRSDHRMCFYLEDEDGHWVYC